MAEGSDAGATADNPRPRERRRKVWDRAYPFHPFLFAAAAVFALMARNLNFASFADVAPSLLGSLAFALVVYLAVAAMRRRFDAAGAVVASIWVAGSLFYLGLFGQLNDMVSGGFPMVRSLPFAFAILSLLTLIALRLHRLTRLAHSILNGVALVLLATPLWQVGVYEWHNGKARAAYDAEQALAEVRQYLPAEESADRPPDIYHFVFDRYTSEEILQRHYDLDNRSIGRFLEERGFYVARRSNSNYQKTGHSVASTFYLDYLDFLEDDPRVKGANWRPIYEMLDDHRVGRVLKSRGYDFIQFGAWWVGTYNSTLADENRPHGFSEFAMLYLRRTILRPIFHTLPDTALTMRLDWDNAQCQRVAPQVEEIKSIGERERPVYVFAHFLVPHGPYPFTADGRCLSQKESAERGEKQGFVDQVAYANRIIRDVVTTLQADGREPPIILIQADEGPFPERGSRVPWQDAPAEELRIKTGIFNAYYFPGKDYLQLTDDITPVNSYRVLFNTYFDANFPLLSDRIYAFPNDATIYEFHDVTNKIREPASIADTMPGARAGPVDRDTLDPPPPSVER
ncbi:LTA synthase family protein [Chelativorans salis]|uniref:LTA synthase family protein n=1 Tax=Chelativorans salis TaxID=2978478 RepID=A0ABT2LV74_9HYPH|nr:LTA synthase family protein [Chelativorans sp. EGI FJ00035]MCT7378425.1 LTA synthase family protein [Chelativorans sp. EGI FJ00035]